MSPLCPTRRRPPSSSADMPRSLRLRHRPARRTCCARATDRPAASGSLGVFALNRRFASRSCPCLAENGDLARMCPALVSRAESNKSLNRHYAAEKIALVSCANEIRAKSRNRVGSRSKNDPHRRFSVNWRCWLRRRGEMCCRRMLVEGAGTLREDARGRDVVPCWRILGEGAGYLAGGCSGRFPRKEADRFRDASRSRHVDHHLAVVVVSGLSCWKAL